jgi:hypothetical protein
MAITISSHNPTIRHRSRIIRQRSLRQIIRRHHNSSLRRTTHLRPSSRKMIQLRRRQIILLRLRQTISAAVDPGNGITLPSGTRVTIRTVDAIDSNRNHVGDQFTATLDQALYVNGALVAPRGAYVYGRLEEIKESGQLSGRAQLRLALTGISLRGQTYPLVSGDYQLSGKSRSTGTAAKVGGGAVVGALIGAAVGGGKGAAIGAGVGAGAGTVAQIAAKGDQIHVPSETILDFTLDQPSTLPAVQNN